MIKSLIYTAIFGNYDRLRPPKLDGDAEFRVYTDALTQIIFPWRERVRECVDEPRRCARKVKILAHEIDSLPDSVTIWHGGNVQLRSPLSLLLSPLDTADIAVLRHPQRDCIYDEADACIAWHKDDPDVIAAQMQRYADDGYPHHNGLSMLFVIVRRNTPEIRRLNEMWWQEIVNGSVRDQLSFDYCCWKLGITPAIIPGGIYEGPSYKRFANH